MSETTNLKLFKHNEPLESNQNQFDIDLALNQNWDKIDDFADKVNDKVIEIEDKNDVQDTEIANVKQNISTIQQEQLNQNTDISQNKTDIELLEENLADEITTEEAEEMTIKDATRWYSKLDVSGNSVQEQTSQSKNLWWDNTTRTFDSANNRTQQTSQTVKAGTYTFSCDISNLSLGTNTKMNLSGENIYDDGTSNLSFMWIENITRNGRYTKSITITGKNIIELRLKIAAGEINNGGSMTISNICLREDDSDEYVEFVPDSPSSNTSSKINNCEKSINIKIENANKIDKNAEHEEQLIIFPLKQNQRLMKRRLSSN